MSKQPACGIQLNAAEADSTSHPTSQGGRWLIGKRSVYDSLC